MDYKTVSSQNTIKEELLKNPRKADEFDRVWKQIYNFYYYTKKFDIHKIKSQERWDEFFKNIDKKLLKSIKHKAVLDPELWLYGSVSQDKDIQGMIMANAINPVHEEKDEHKSSDSHDHHALSHSSAHREVGATPVASTIPAPITTNPIIVTKNTPAPAAVPIQIITQTRTPVSQILANTAKQGATPLKILTQQMAKNPAPSQPIQLVTQTRAPISTLLSTSAGSPTFQEPETQSIIVTGPDAREIPPASPPGDTSSPLIMPRQRFSPPQPTMPSTPHAPIPRGVAGGGSRGAGGSHGVPGSMGKLASTAVTAGINALPGGVIVTTIWKNKKVIAGLLVFLLFFFSTFFNEDNTTTTILPTGVKTADPVEQVDNPPAEIPELPSGCIANPSLCNLGQEDSGRLLARSEETRVLGTKTQAEQAKVKGISDIIKNFGDLLKSEITYSITASYPGVADDIIVTDPVPNEVLFIAASGICNTVRDPVSKKVTSVWWSVKENQRVDQSALNCTEIGSSSTTPGTNVSATKSAGITFSPITFKNRILPLQRNKVFTSSAATVEVIGGRGSTGTATGSATTSGAGCTKISDPQGDAWAKINSRDQVILAKVNEITQSIGVCVPANLVKALIYEESGGEMLDVSGDAYGNGAGYGGIMQVGTESNCDHNKYNIRTVDGNVGCGIEHLAHGYADCGTWEGTVTAYYAGHCVPNGAHDNVADGGSGETDYQYRDRIIGRWHEIDAAGK